MLRKLPFRRLAAVAAALAMILAVQSVAAAPLTAGNVTYIVNGEETSFPFDPIARKDGQLLPQDVFSSLGITVTVTDRTVTLAKQDVEATLTLGSTAATLGDELITVAPAPVRVSGRLFLPAGMLEEFGYEVSADGGYVMIRDLAQGISTQSNLDQAAYNALRSRLTVTSSVRSDDQKAYLGVEVTFLTPELVASRFFSASWKQRVRYLNLLQSNSLLLVTAKNQTGRSATLNPASIMLVDTVGQKQFDVEYALEHQGLISGKIASGGSKASVLVYPKVDPAVTSVAIFADTNPGNIGSVATR